MYNPNDDPDITSGLRDDAKKEMATPGTSHGSGGERLELRAALRAQR